MMGSGRPDAVAEGVAGVITEPEMESARSRPRPTCSAAATVRRGRAARADGSSGGGDRWRRGRLRRRCSGAAHRALPATTPPTCTDTICRSLCTGQNLQPLTDALAAEGLILSTGTTRHGAARWTMPPARSTDRRRRAAAGARCTRSESLSICTGRPTPGRSSRTPCTWRRPARCRGRPSLRGRRRRRGDQLFPGLGDLAFLTTSRSYQSLSVLRGGAVLTRCRRRERVGAGRRDAGLRRQLTGRPPLADTTRLRPVLPGTVRNRRGVLSR